MKHYTFRDLLDVKQEYSDNMRRLLMCVNTRYHDVYLHEEKRLYRKELKIQKYLGVYINDPCPIHGVKMCKDCSGYYRRKTRFHHGKYYKTANWMCSSKHPDAHKCMFKRKEVKKCKSSILPQLDLISRNYY